MDQAVMIDTRHPLETPEGTDLSLYPAGFWVRSLAYTIDWLIRVAVVVATGFLFSASGIGQGMTLVVYFLMEWFYPVYFELCHNGQTIGKKALHLKVINDDGTPVTFAASLIRNLLRTVDFLPVFYISAIIASLCNRDFKRLGDLAAGTLVVYTNPIKPSPAIDNVGVRPVPEGFSTDEQRVLVTFAQRSATMSGARQAELANIISPLVAPGDPVVAIKQMANHIVGRRADSP